MLIRNLAAFALLLASSGCIPSGLAAQREHQGYMLVRWPTDEAYGLPGDQALPEVSRAEVPAEVLAGADAYSRNIKNNGPRWQPECTRFFRGPDRYAALFVVVCRRSPMSRIVHDNATIVVFLLDGAQVTPPARLLEYDGRMEVHPVTRDPVSDPVP